MIKNETLKSICFGLASSIIAMASFWLIEGRHYTTRVDVQQYVKDEIAHAAAVNPYLQDRQTLMELVTEFKNLTREMKKEMESLKVQVAILNEKIGNRSIIFEKTSEFSPKDGVSPR